MDEIIMEWSSVLGFKGLGPQCVFSIGHELKWNGWGVEYQTSPSLLFCAAAAYFKRVSSTPTPRAESKLLRRIHKFTCQKNKANLFVSILKIDAGHG